GWGGWGGVLWLAGAGAVFGQAYFTPVRASWTEDPATTATITWDTPSASRGTVQYGPTSNYTHAVHDGGGIHKHVVTLRRLDPGTRYFYEASSTDGYAQAGTFRTAPERGQPLHFAFHGDLQGGLTNEAWAQGVSDRIVAEDPPFIVSLGDMAEEAFSGTGFETWEIFFRICSNELARAVFMPIMGNHDAAPGSDFTRGLYHRLFSLPNPSLGHGQYAYTVGNLRFMVLNSEAELTGQAEWLAREMQAAVNDTNLVWTIVLWHQPPYSYGERKSWEAGQDNWSPVLVRYEADWMVGGHSHNYQRMVPIRGVRYLVAGGGGGRPYGSATNHPTHEFATTCYHHVSAHVTNDVMQLRGIRSDGLVFDSVTVTNRRQVRVEPAFPRRGQAAKIHYRATEGPLTNANPVHIHLGQDAFTTAFADGPMTWNAASQRWEYEFTVPAAATNRLAFVFHNGAGTYHNNHVHDWQALLARAGVLPDPPAAGSNVIIRYEADMGVLAGAARVDAWVSFDGGRIPATGAVAMANSGGATWECTVPVPAHAKSLSFVFSTDNNGWDDDWRRQWTFPVAGPFAAGWPPAAVAGAGSPVLTDNPPGELPDNIGDNFDLAREGPPLISQENPRGFGDFGRIWFNVDATNLYLGGSDMDIGGSNNAVILFLGVDTLTDDAWTLWHKDGAPHALDFLHNVRFTEPMDVAILLGDTYGDGPAYTNFALGGPGGYDFGQGIWYVGTNSAAFWPMADAKLSQFHGEGTTPCATRGSSTNRRTRRWEAALPWSSLNAAGPESISNLLVCGVVASASVKTNDRYLSRTYLGDRAWGLRDGNGQYAYHTIYLRPQRVNLLHADLLGDGLANEWRQERFGTPDGPPADEDSDGDGQDNRAEETAGTHPLDRNSRFVVELDPPAPGVPFALHWPFAANRFYDVDFTTNLLQPFAPLATGLATNAYAPGFEGFYRVQVRK
ncbi:MAG: hypothetical protein EOM72_00405, partial [Opitutae bacterium]|nr:hypothetical protein [Opitutae bacterium]